MRLLSRSSHNLRLSVVIFLVFCWTFSAASPASTSDHLEELLIGIEPEHNIFDQVERYRYLTNYLGEKLGVRVKLTIMSRYGELIKRFKTLRLDGAFLTSYTATMGINQLQLEPLANPVNLNGESTSQGYLFVRKDRNIHSIQDMERSNIVFVDPATMEGYLFPLAFLKQHGVKNINVFFNRYYFSGSNASAIFAVLDGRADIGSAKNTTFDNLVKNDPSIGQELKVLARSSKVPEITLCIKSKIAPDFREKLTDILLQMDKSPAGRKVLEQFKARRFVKSSKEDFIIIEEMARKALGAIAVHGK